ncbi:hypothetical protein [Pedobacter sp. JCM 36344]|uniref:hypothetical protein n=1 Tax=Pedobacter sp. JCM 36344 TaxID=3374280 RepID=UPI00397AF065
MAYLKKNSNRSNSNSSNQEQKKHSGAKKGFTKKNEPYCTGWNYSKRHGLITFLCVPYAKTAVHTSGNGVEWLNVMVKVTRGIAGTSITSGLMDRRTHRTIVKELGIVINPGAPKGGYCGRYGKN